jgi:RNA polymerase sigma factor (sigma-70 family)
VEAVEKILLVARPAAAAAPPDADAADPSDAALIARIARGDHAALGELYDRHGRVAYGLAIRVVRDPALAEDAVQEAFLSVFRSAGGFSPARGTPKTWLLTLVHRRAVDLVRRQQRVSAEPLDVVEHAAGEATDEEAAVREQRRAVQAALRLLTPEQRESLELAYYGGYSQSEIAERLGVPLGTVKSRMFAGLAALRELLGPDL